ncbi:hypothetical protein Rumeso_03202 [Rubellimicrobium mesophilum DSM 19309]|uniref:Uncharacterized protein n=1 Tax=Rubellimicrobium mesophilum DSM 19309 TaxID=442562 RepID=A0A017HLL9_9RHOB|nr:hypothetical protein Rumeso_03202 [Rubellimicrobium mesophilum DSM 19309]
MATTPVHLPIERVVLEHHGDVPVLGLELVDARLVYGDLAPSDDIEPREHPQKGGLAAAGGTDEDDELSVLEAGVHAVHDGRIAVGRAPFRRALHVA